MKTSFMPYSPSRNADTGITFLSSFKIDFIISTVVAAIP